ncbi:hypothetical protein LCGC14_1241730 [marine sediment metagenome]|uniref:Uncharacterized protein n=1 Tax=marine sediment metagenome TaxID=412755 RepID=A0A0F9L9M1_9ZZZZ
MAIDYKTSPYIVMAIHGYHPFTPDAGILCGGYQSPIYPHPTTFEQPVLDSAILLANDRRASAYSMKVEGDFYEGLGKWNPSINWHNPGHLLGIFDTFNRMGYGLAVLKEIKAGSIITPEEILNPITVKIPFKTAGDLLTEEFTLDDIYVLGFSEKPMLYIPSFVDEDGNLILDPRINPGFDFTGAHTPSVVEDETSIAGMQTIFRDKDSSSYLYMRQPLVDIHTELSSFAIENIGNEESFVDLSVVDLSDIGNTREKIPRMPITEELFDGLDSHETFPSVFQDSPSATFPQRRSFYNNFTTLTQAEAVKVLTGTDQFHTAGQIDGAPAGLEVLEHRTLTELNSVINLVPVQTYGMVFGNFFNYDFTDWFVSSELPQTYISWLICDIILTSNVAQTINIAGTATTERTASEGNGVFDSFFTVRNFAVATSCTRDFTWNRSWWDLPPSNVKNSTSEERATNTQSWVRDFTFSHQDPGEFGISFLPLPYITKDEFDINESIVLNGTGQTVRVRIILQSQTIGHKFIDLNEPIGSRVNRRAGDDLTIDIAVNGETMDFTHTSTLLGLPEV